MRLKNCQSGIKHLLPTQYNGGGSYIKRTTVYSYLGFWFVSHVDTAMTLALFHNNRSHDWSTFIVNGDVEVCYSMSLLRFIWERKIHEGPPRKRQRQWGRWLHCMCATVASHNLPVYNCMAKTSTQCYKVLCRSASKLFRGILCNIWNHNLDRLIGSYIIIYIYPKAYYNIYSEDTSQSAIKIHSKLFWV